MLSDLQIIIIVKSLDKHCLLIVAAFQLYVQRATFSKKRTGISL